MLFSRFNLTKIDEDSSRSEYTPARPDSERLRNITGPTRPRPLRATIGSPEAPPAEPVFAECIRSDRRPLQESDRTANISQPQVSAPADRAADRIPRREPVSNRLSRALRDDHPVLTSNLLHVRPLEAADEAAWRTLWKDYQTFYEVALSEDVFATTWARLHDPHEPMFGLGAFDAAGTLLGLVHALYHRSCWTIARRCYLEDLFTSADARGRGVGRALIDAVCERARADGASEVYWLTHDTNTTARALYDALATRTGFIEYAKKLR